MNSLLMLRSIDLNDPSEQMTWKKFLSEQQAWLGFTTEIKRLEYEINKKVYALFELKADEIKRLETSLNG